jgi:hypothetical protein
MKNYFILMMVLSTLPAIAGIDVSAIEGSKKISVSLDGVSESAKIELFDPEGGVIMSKKVKTSSYHAIFDLAALPEGTYLLSVFLTNKEWVQPVIKNEYGIAIDKKAAKEYFNPTFHNVGKKIDFAMFNQFLSPVEIQILNQNGLQVFREKMGSVLRVEKRFNLSTLEAGDYTMVVRANGRNYYHTFRQ